MAAFGQSDTASISGQVKDPSNAPVPGATIVVRNENTGVERRAQTNPAGGYVITSVPPGRYTVEATAQGFQQMSKTGNQVDANIALRVDLTLTLGNVSSTVSVQANAATVQSETATVGKLVTQEQVQKLQLNGRNPLYLAQLQPGVRRGSSISSFNFGLDNGGYNINGSRGEQNLISVDGAPAVRTRSNGTSIGVADADATQEVQVLTANYLPEYGRSSGGQIRIVTKSGSSKFHGTAYEYLRNSAMDANTWERNASGTDLSGTPAPFRFNQFGYNINGPIFIPHHFNSDRTKLFFLFSQEYIRYRQDTTQTGVVPTAAMRQGDFSELLQPGNIFYGSAKQILQPGTNTPYPGNVIPASQLSANGRALLSAYPAPNVAGANYNWIDSGSAPQNQRKDTGAIDYNPNEKHAFRFRVQNYEYNSVSPFYGNFNLMPQLWDRPNQTASLNYIYTISPTAVNEFLASASVDHVYINIDTSSGLYNRANYGINYPYIFPDDKEIANKIPTIQLSQGGFTTLDGGPYPSKSAGPIFDFSDNFTKIWGNHTVKVGFLFERAGENDFDQINVDSTIPGSTNNQNGRFVFSDTRTGAPTTGAAVANAALGLFDTYAEIGQRNYTPYRGNMYEWFAQDSWKVTPKLRLEYGVRQTLIQPYYSLWGNMAVFDQRYYNPSTAAVVDPATGYVVGGDRYDGVVIPGSGFPSAALGRIPGADTGEYANLFKGLSRSYAGMQWQTFQPRVGIAYSFDSKTVFRAGGGRFMDRVGLNDKVFLGGNPPFQPTVTVTNGVADNPGGNGTANYPQTVTTQTLHLNNPEAWTWNATLERELPGGFTASVGYVGRRGLHLQTLMNINQLQAGTIQANPDVSVDSLRPFQGYSVISQNDDVGTSLYQGLQLNLNRRFRNGLSIGVAYTYSYSSDTSSSYTTMLPNTYDMNSNWGPSDFDTRHVLLVNYIYDLPFFAKSQGLLHTALGGWEITGTTQAQTGTPYTIATSTDYAGVGPGSGSQMWNINGALSTPAKFSNSTSDSNYYFSILNTDGSPIFTAPAAGTFTAQRNRNKIFAPGFQSWNIGLMKNFAITESQGVQFKFEAFNFINHPNWSVTNDAGSSTGFADPTSGGFGKILTKTGSRSLQLSLRYSF